MGAHVPRKQTLWSSQPAPRTRRFATLDPMPMTLPPTSLLTAEDRLWLQTFLRNRPLFRLYFEAALADLQRGIDNRIAYVGESRQGALLGIHFEHLTVYTALGQLSPNELAATLGTPHSAELHVESQHEAKLLPLCGARLLKVSGQRVYARPTSGAQRDTAIRQLWHTDAPAARAFMRSHYPRTIFSEWMLDLPFVALEEHGELIGTAGTIAVQGELALAGNFLTHPAHRGRGTARRLAMHLAALLAQSGIQTVVLVTTDDNPAACRAYEAAGFEVMERRRQIDLAAQAPT